MLEVCTVFILCVLWLGRPSSATEGSINDKIYFMKITLPERPARDENSDIISINNILNSATDVDVLMSVKEVGNPIISTVLKVQNDCSWAQITSQLSARGDKFSVNPVVSCQDFASELNTTVTTSLNFRPKHFSHLIFPVHGRTEGSYLASIAEFMRTVGTYSDPMITDLKMACFGKTLDVPFEMYFFSEEATSSDLQYAEALGAGVLFDITLRYIHDLNDYANTCTNM